MAGQIGLFAMLNHTPNLTGIMYKAETWQTGSFLHWAIVYKNVENGPDGIVTEVAKWC